MLKLPTLSKLPKYKRFEIVTRFYNPEKEEFETRVRMAEQRLEAENQAKENEKQLSREERIKYALRRQRKHQPQGIAQLFDSTFLLRIGIMLFVTFGLWAYVMYGEEIIKWIDGNWAIYGIVILGLFVISKVIKR